MPPRQMALTLRAWGGARRNAGRKPTGVRAGVPHAPRASPAGRYPAHVTLRMLGHVYNLRARRCFRVIERSLRRGRERFGFRAVEFAVLGNHLHLIVEAEDAVALGRGMKGLGVRLARGLNRLMGRKGAVLADRYHSRLLRSPKEVRSALVYVLHNANAHFGLTGVDPLSSAPWFDGFRHMVRRRTDPPILVRARTWLLGVGWLRHGMIGLRELPGS